MSKTNWKKLINPDYLGAYSLDDGNGKYNDLIVTIRNVKTENVTGPEGKHETCPVAYFSENGIKPMVLNATNMKTLEKLFHSKYIEDWCGQKIQLCVASVKAFGDVVDALRIRPFKPKPEAPKQQTPKQEAPVLKCADCGKEIQAFDNRHDAKYMAQYTTKHYGKPLCAECAEKEKAAEAAKKMDDPEEEIKPTGTESKEDGLI